VAANDPVNQMAGRLCARDTGKDLSGNWMSDVQLAPNSGTGQTATIAY
jgi:hypothetical protein